MFHKTNDSNDTSGPIESRYYSTTDGGVYYLYLFAINPLLLSRQRNANAPLDILKILFCEATWISLGD
jgi:hypothetical protein